MKHTKDRWYLWLALAAFCLFFTGGKFNFFAAAWLGNIFFLRFMRERKAWAGYLMAVGVAWMVSTISWAGIQPATGIAYVINMLITAFMSSLPLLADKLLHKKLPGWLGTLVFPIASTALDFAFVAVNPMGSFGAIGYSQFAFTPFLQFASVGGLTGMAFLLSWFPAVINHVWERGWKASRTFAIVAAAMYAAVIGFGIVRLAASPRNPETVTVSMIVRGDGDGNLRTVMGSEGTSEAAERILTGLVAETESEAAAGSRIIAWPEGAVISSEAEIDSTRNRLGMLADNLDIYLAVPYFVPVEDTYENGLDIYSPEGEVVLNHIKYGGNLFEGSVPGDGTLTVIDTEYGRISAAICWDMDFPAAIQQLGRQSVDILISPSLEWAEIVPTHAQMAVFRGVENGITTVHPASMGLSVAADRYGRVLGESNWFDSSATALRVEVPTKGSETIYGRVGEVIGQASMLLTLVLVVYGTVVGIVAGRRKKREQAGNQDR